MQTFSVQARKSTFCRLPTIMFKIPTKAENERKLSTKCRLCVKIICPSKERRKKEAKKTWAIFTVYCVMSKVPTWYTFFHLNKKKSIRFNDFFVLPANGLNCRSNDQIWQKMPTPKIRGVTSHTHTLSLRLDPTLTDELKPQTPPSYPYVLQFSNLSEIDFKIEPVKWDPYWIFSEFWAPAPSQTTQFAN